MLFLLSGIDSATPRQQALTDAPDNLNADQALITSAEDLLQRYLDTDEKAPLMPVLVEIRDEVIDDLDQIDHIPHIYGLMYWLMSDYGVDNRGETLEETADRLGDIDIENDSDRYTDLIFHLKDAVERLYDLELD